MHHLKWYTRNSLDSYTYLFMSTGAYLSTVLSTPNPYLYQYRVTVTLKCYSMYLYLHYIKHPNTHLGVFKNLNINTLTYPRAGQVGVCRMYVVGVWEIQFGSCLWHPLHDFTRSSKVLFIWLIFLPFTTSFNSIELRLYCRIYFSKPDVLRQISELASEPLDVEVSLPAGNRRRISSDHLA